MLDKIRTKNIGFFEDITQYGEYDFHNDYCCREIIYSDSKLTLLMIDNSNNEVYISFEEVIIKNITFNIHDDRIIDSLYRGRAEINGQLVDVFENDFSYFYLEFYEGNKMEFWAKYLSIYECPQ